VRLPAQGTLPAGTRELDDLTYVLASEWVSEEVKGGGPDLKGHYVLKVSGRPYAELYVSSEAVAQGQSLEQVLQAGIDKVRDKLPDYQPMGTRRIKLGDIDAIVHDFGYSLGTPFRGRSYVLILDNTSYSFFFNTAGGYFASVEKSYTSVMSSVTRRARTAQPAAGAAPATVEEHGLLLDLPAGWRPSGDAAGAKYRCYDAEGRTLASFFPLHSEALILAILGPIDSQVSSFVDDKRNGFAGQFQDVVFGPAQRLQVGDLDVRSLEFTCKQGQVKGFFRWYFIPVKDKEDTDTMQYGWSMCQFGFFAVQGDQLEARKAQFDAIIKTARKKGAGAAAAPATQPATGDLPTLEPEGEQPNMFRDAAGRFELPLPDGAKQGARDRVLAAYTVADKAADIEVHCLPSAAEAAAKVEAIGAGKKQNGQESIWQVGGKETTVRLYTHKNEAGATMATVTACYPTVALVVVVVVPAKGYAEAQAWIAQFLKGLRFTG
jgi:hypothetical protein